MSGANIRLFPSVVGHEEGTGGAFEPLVTMLKNAPKSNRKRRKYSSELSKITLSTVIHY